MKRSRMIGNVPLYIHMYEDLKEQILTGELTPGTRIKSKRVMADLTGTSVNTVDGAYQQLVSEGYLEVRPQSGFYVTDPGPFSRSSARASQADPKAFLRSNNADQTLADIKKQEEPEMIDFSPNAVDMNCFPVAKLRKYVREVFDLPANRLLPASDAAGLFCLRESLSRYLHSSRGLSCHPDQIVIGAGTDFILQLLLQILRSVSVVSAVAMENPLYNKAYQIFSGQNVPIRLIPVEKDGLRTDTLRESDANIIYLTPSHQFPLGFVLPIKKRHEILAWAIEQDNRYIIEDDYDSEFRYAGRPIPAIGETDRNGRVIYLGTFSKSVAPSVRISYLVLPEPLADAFRRNFSYYATTVTTTEQLILSRFIQSGDFEKHIAKMRTIYRKKRDILQTSLHAFRNELTVRGNDAGLHLILSVKNGMSENELCQNSQEHQVKVYGLSSYFIGEVPDLYSRERGTVLLGYAGLSEDEIQEGVSRLRSAWNLT